MKLTLVPYCGLCNRLNMIENALTLKRMRPDYEMHVYWKKSDDCCAWFDELFEPVPGMEISRQKAFYLIHKGKYFLWLPELIRKFKFDASVKCRKVAKTDDLLHPDPKWQCVYVCGYNAMCSLRDYSMLSRLFRPVPEIAERISEVTSSYGSHVMGIHVRRTDHVKVISHSPLENYVKRMEQYAGKYDDAQFFVATDDESVKRELHNHFGQRIISLPSVLERNSLQGMKDAVVELFCLGSCHCLLGSQYSTYSRFAAALYDIPSEDVETGHCFVKD